MRSNGKINELVGDFHGFSIAMSDCRRVWTLMGKTNWETMGKLWEIWNIKKTYGKWRRTGCRIICTAMNIICWYIYIYTVPNLYAFCLNKRSCNFCSDGSAFAVDFAILRSHFWYRQTVPKMGPWKCFSFVLLLSCACGPKNGTARRSHFWDRV